MQHSKNGYDEDVAELLSGNPPHNTKKLLEETDKYLARVRKETPKPFPVWLKWPLILAGTGAAVYGLFQIEAVRKKWNDAMEAISDFLMADTFENSSGMPYSDEDDPDYGLAEFRFERDSLLSAAD